MKVLTIKSVDGGLVQMVHLLNPGEWFPNFGGSRHSLPVKKTASLIITQRGNGLYKDTEYDIHDKDVWKWIGEMLDPTKVTVLKEGPCPHGIDTGFYCKECPNHTAQGVSGTSKTD